MRVAIVIDGVEAIRQIHSDAGRFVVETIEDMELGGRSPQCTVFGDTNIDELMLALRARTFELVVFTSNALRHQDGRMARAIWKDRAAIDTYLDHEGSVVVLHQFTDGPLPIRVSPGQDLRFVKSPSPTLSPVLTATHQTLFGLPHRIESPDLSSSGQLARTPHWLAVHPEAAGAMTTLIGTEDHGMLVGLSSLEQPGRVIACSYPLDWHRAAKLLQNLVRFAINGDEPWIVGAAVDGYVPPVASGVLSLRARAEVVREPADRPWVEELPTTHVYGSQEQLTAALSRESVRSSVRRGGVHLCVEIGPDATTKVVAHVGSRFHQFAGILKTHIGLRSDWNLGTDLFPRRNYLEAIRFFEGSDVEPVHAGTIDAQEAQRLAYPGITLSSVLCLSQILLAGRATDAVRARFRRETLGPAMEEAGSDTGGRLLLDAALMSLRGDGDVTAWHVRALDQVTRAEPSAAEALRILEWCSVLARVLPGEQDSQDRDELISVLVGVVYANSSEGICLSLEGTANLLIAIATALPPAQAKIILADGMDCVIAAHRGLAELATRDTTDGTADASIVARLCHALAAAEALMPLGLDRLGEVIGANTKVAGRGLDENHLRLLDRNRELAVRQSQLEQQHLVRARLWQIGVVAVWLLLVLLELSILLGSTYLARRTGQYWEFLTAGAVVGAFALWFLGSWMRGLELLPRRLAAAIAFLDERFGAQRGA